MVEEFIREVFLKDQPPLTLRTAATRLESGEENKKAREKSASKSRELYAGKSLHTLLEECQKQYTELQALKIVPDDHLLADHAWISKYLPLFCREYVEPLATTLMRQYHYTDNSERDLLCMAALMLAYHSYPNLFSDKPEEFKALSATWLEALLTFNCISNPPLAKKIRGWHDRKYYSTHRNLLFIEAYSKEAAFNLHRECSLRINALFTPETKQMLLRLAVISHAISQILPAVMTDYVNKINSRNFPEAIARLQYLKDHASEFQDTPPLPAYSLPTATLGYLSMPTTQADLAAVANNILPPYATPEEATQQAAGFEIVEGSVYALADFMALQRDQSLTPSARAATEARVMQSAAQIQAQVL
jgi:hypothetical protein